MVYPTLPGSQIWDRAGRSSIEPSTLVPASVGTATVSGDEDWRGPLAAGLDAEERAIFDGLIASAPTGQFKASDTPLLCAYVHACALERRAAELIRHDLVNASAATLKVYAEAVKSMCELAGVLLLCPQGRVPKDPRGRPRKPRSAAGEPPDPASGA
jgi:hypothetical protein